ncbi:MAG: presenilin family intramembrane aspartyl protease [Candidatus Bathyarchaeia archaeon]
MSKFKARIIHLTPILTSLIFGFICSFILLESSLRLHSVTPFPESPEGSIGNAFYFVVLLLVGATILLTLLRIKNPRLVLVFTGTVVSITIFFLSAVYLLALSTIIFPIRFEAILIFSACLTLSSLYLIFKASNRVSSLVIIAIGGALGAFLGSSIQTLSTLAILCFLAFYDIFAVYRGPIGKIASQGLEKIRGLILSFKDVHIGLGDLTFYSMLMGHMLLNFGIIACLMSMVGILTGCYLTLKMLEKKEIFPGLPLPIFLGLASGFISTLL